MTVHGSKPVANRWRILCAASVCRIKATLLTTVATFRSLSDGQAELNRRSTTSEELAFRVKKYAG